MMIDAKGGPTAAFLRVRPGAVKKRVFEPAVEKLPGSRHWDNWTCALLYCIRYRRVRGRVEDHR